MPDDRLDRLGRFYEWFTKVGSPIVSFEEFIRRVKAGTLEWTFK
jgi:hypothetical protein